MYYKDEYHEQQTKELLAVFNKEEVLDDIEYGVFSYLVGGIGKVKGIKKTIDEYGNIDISKVYKEIEVYSSSERSIVRFAMQCFNSNIDDITLAELMYSLDASNTRLVKQAIDLRY